MKVTREGRELTLIAETGLEESALDRFESHYDTRHPKLKEALALLVSAGDENSVHPNVKLARNILSNLMNTHAEEVVGDQLVIVTPQTIMDLRESLGWTQKELAKRVGVTKATVSLWETGSGGIQPRNKRKLVQIIKKVTNA